MNCTYVKHSNSLDSGVIRKPTTLEYGELALNYKDGYESLFFKNDSGTIITINDWAKIRNRPTALSVFTNDMSYVTENDLNGIFQPYSAVLSSISSLGTANSMIYASSANTYAAVTTSSFGRSLLNATSGTVFSGLNADLLDSLHATDFIRAVSANGYYGLAEPGGGTSNWIRTTVNGIIPYQSGGYSSLGTSSWPFNDVYANNFHGSLSGNASSATKLATARTIGLSTGVTANATAFDGTGNITIPVTSIYESYLSWGGKNYSGTYGCIDAAMISNLGANRLAFLHPTGITVEYSRDSGSTWTDYGATDAAKTGLFSGTNLSSFTIGKADSSNKATSAYQLRITINTGSAGIYTVLNKFCVFCATNGSSGSTCTIEKALESTPDTFVMDSDSISISGWSGYNIINNSGICTYGNTPASQYGRIRFTFKCTDGSTTYNGLTVFAIYGFGGVGWATPSWMASTGHIYSWDANQNVTFPSNVTASSFIGSGIGLTGTASSLSIGGNAATATRLQTARTIWGQSFDGSGNISGAITGATTASFSGQVTSTVTTGTAPFIIASTTTVSNLNSDLWDGYHFSDYLNQAVKTTNSPTFSGINLSNPIISSYTSSTWINSVSNAVLNCTQTGFGGIFNARVKDGRIALATYPSSDDKVYLGYATDAQISAGTNSYNQSIYWDAAGNILNLHALNATGNVTVGGTLGVTGTSNFSDTVYVGNSHYGTVSIELYGATPLIDFHYNNSSADYTSRIIEYGSGLVSIMNSQGLYLGNSYVSTQSQRLYVDGTAYIAGATTIASTLNVNGNTILNGLTITNGTHSVNITVDSSGYLSNPNGYVTESDLMGVFQPYDADLSSIAGLSGTSGLLRKTAANTWTLDTNTYLTGITSSLVTTALGFTPYSSTNPNGYVAENDLTGVFQPYDADLSSIAGLSGTSGLLRKTAANTYTLDTTTYLTNDSLVRLTATGDAGLTSTGHAFQIGGTSTMNLIFDQNEIMARNNGAANTLFINFDGGLVEIGTGGLKVDGFAQITGLNVGQEAWFPTIYATTDDCYDVGSADYRFSNIYATSGAINTSDAREKTSVTPLTTDEINAAIALSKEIGTFQFLSAIEKKGTDNARYHVGMTVQRAIEIMQANNLDPFKYGFICYDTWAEKMLSDGTKRAAGDRYGFRVDELNLFMMRGLSEKLL